MDRILYFRITGKRQKNNDYRVQVFRKRSCGKDIIYVQLCGYPDKEQVPLVQGEMQKAVERILACGRKQEEVTQNWLVYEYHFEKWLESVEHTVLWRRMWRLPLYDAFYEKENVEYMLAKIPTDHFPKEVWILGYGPDIKEVIFGLSSRIRTLTFWVEFVTRSLEKLTQELEEELGLVSQIKLIPPGGMKKERFSCNQPILVLDYSGRENISAIGLCKGSVWLDMDSVESKRHGIEDRGIGMQYISMIKIWKEEMLQTLDTISNIEYNTGVILDGLGR